VGRCLECEADWAPPLYNRRIIGGAVSTASSSRIAVGLAERQRLLQLYRTWTVQLIYWLARKIQKLRLLGNKLFFFWVVKQRMLELFNAVSEHPVGHIFGCLTVEDGTDTQPHKIG